MDRRGTATRGLPDRRVEPYPSLRPLFPSPAAWRPSPSLPPAVALLQIPRGGREISDAIVSFDAETLERLPVRKDAVVAEFRGAGNEQAARVVEALPARGGELDPDAVDRLLVAIHCEMQRLAEEFHHGRRVAELLRPLLGALREGGARPPVRVVDVGCGTGFVVRWLAAHGGLGDEVELVGADYHAALVAEARRLAADEGLRCDFQVANAFALEGGAAVFISTGVLHHFRGAALGEVLAAHERAEAQAFVHFDFHPSPLAPLGSWLFHLVRMRHPLARHDGVLSAVRAHPADALLDAARRGAPGFDSAVYGTRPWGLPVPRVFHTLVGVRPRHRGAFERRLGRKALLLGVRR